MRVRGLVYGLGVGLFLLLAIANNGAADTPVSGIIDANTTWTLGGSPYIVIGSLLVNSGVTLAIEPGVVVRFDTSKVLRIDGELIARGVEGEMITFTSNQSTPAAGDWGYILFSDSSNDAAYDGDGNYTGGCILECCIVEYAGGANVSDNGGVRMNNAHPFINYCTIQNNSEPGIYAWGLTGNLKIANSTVTNNTSSSSSGGGIYVSGGTAIISGNTIINNTGSSYSYGVGGGIYLYGSMGTIIDNSIRSNTAYQGGGIYATGGNVTITNNIIMNNIARGAAEMGGGIYIRSIAEIAENIISNNTASSYGGGGIFVYGGTTGIAKNIITNNTGGSGGGILVCAGGETTITHNIVCNNTGCGITSIYSATAPNIRSNSIIRNSAPSASALSYGGNRDNQDVKYNTIVENLATGDQPTYTVYISLYPLFNFNNIQDNIATYDLWNYNPEGSPDAKAESNWWGTAVESEIQDKIYDWYDDFARGIVDYTPWETAIRSDSPVSPPTGLAVSATDTDIIMSWYANPESDVAGYKVYWGTQAEPFFENVVDVGNYLGHTITGLAAGTYYVAVTAYDTDYVAANDDPNTIVNENQTNGNESWYTTATVLVGAPGTLTLLDPNGAEKLLAGQTFTITWQSEGPISNVLIEYSTNNGFNWTPIATVANTGSYPWPVPAVNSEQCLVAIADAGNLAVTDTSDDVFTIFVCQGSFAGDMNGDCYVDWLDFSIFANEWLKCGNPFDPNCGY